MCDVRKDRQTDGRTDRGTDGHTDDGKVVLKCHLCLQQVTQKGVGVYQGMGLYYRFYSI